MTEQKTIIQKVEEIISNNIFDVKIVYEDRTEKRRLFQRDGNIYIFKKGSRKYGYSLRDDVRYIKDIIEIKSRTTESDRWLKGINKAISLLEHSGLWKDMLNDLKIARDIGHNKLQQAYKTTDMKFKEDYKENQDEIVKNIKLIDSRLIDTDKTTGKEFYKTSILWYMVRTPKIKKMYFGKYKEDLLNRIKQKMRKKEKCSERGQASYDVSFEYNPDTDRAWYSEEFRKCGNGHYYLALDDTYAMFYEDD